MSMFLHLHDFVKLVKEVTPSMSVCLSHMESPGKESLCATAREASSLEAALFCNRPGKCRPGLGYTAGSQAVALRVK